VGAEPAVRLEAVGKRFGRTWGLREVDLEVPPGELVALVGANGAGKTTLLRLVAAVHRATTGQAEVLGLRLPRDEELVRERSTLLPPHGYLYEQLTGLENLRFARLMAGVRPSRDELHAALERVGLVEAADERVGGYSSGMRKRLALARLLLRPVDLVLMDEPYASLDSGGIELVDQIVGELRAEGSTILLASHRWERAIREADRLVVMERGRIQWTGTPEEWMSRPAPPGSGGAPGRRADAGA
jgi:heme exporter protein A